MKTEAPSSQLSDTQIRDIIRKADEQALGGKAGAIARAGLGTLALIVAIFASTEGEMVGLVLLCGVFVLGLGAYIHSVARSISSRPRYDRSSEPRHIEPLRKRPTES